LDQKILDQAIEDHRAGRTAQAEEIYRRILSQKPTLAPVLNLLGVLLGQTDRNEEAIGLIRRAIQLNPSQASFHGNLAHVLKNSAQNESAAAEYRRAIALRENDPEGWRGLGDCLHALEQFAEAADAHRRAIHFKPDYVEAHNNLGMALSKLELWNEAAAAFRAAIALRPEYPRAHHSLGIALKWQGEYAEAIACYRTALKQKPDFVDAWTNLGVALAASMNHAQALAAFNRALELQPDNPMAHWCLALSLLAGGDYSAGWPEYEWRWKTGDTALRPPNYAQPLWDGSDPAGRRIMIYVEQGFGDAIQFIRFIPQLLEVNGKFLLECPPELFTLLNRWPGLKVIPRGQPLPDFDLHIPLLSLPRILGITLDKLPGPIPYLFADPDRLEKWKRRIDPGKHLNIGLVWAGNPQHRQDRSRSATLAAFAPLASIDGLRFFNLQKGPAAAQAENPPSGMTLIDHTAELHDFSDSAALISNLDLVISVDTSIVHIAGALGKPIFVLLAFSPDWRWMIGQSDSPWYPSVRLFRQPKPGDWATPIGQIVETLRNRRPRGQG
jgi:tetratricopeptide (TPR) repeat protein